MHGWVGGGIGDYHFCLQFHSQTEGLFFPSEFPPPRRGSWLIPRRIRVVLCSSSLPLSLPRGEENSFLPGMHVLRNPCLAQESEERELGCTLYTEVPSEVGIIFTLS